MLYVEQGSTDNDGRSNVNDRLEFKIVSTAVTPICHITMSLKLECDSNWNVTQIGK